MVHHAHLFLFNEMDVGTDHNVAPCRVVCSRWARAGPGTLRSTRCTSACHVRHRSVVGRDIRYRRRLARLLLLQQTKNKVEQTANHFSLSL